jgi:RNA polymerase sigma-70 factor (ECF subfamily)
MKSGSLKGRLDEAQDEELVAIVVSTGDPSMFALLVERHHSRIRNWLKQLTGNPALADDLTQDAFLLAWRRLESFKGSGKFSGWITKIAYNHFLRVRHQQARETEVVTAHINDGSQENESRINEAWIELHNLLSLLGEEERLAIVLNYAHGFSHGEISEITGMPVGTVKTHIRRGKARIGEWLEHGEG